MLRNREPRCGSGTRAPPDFGISGVLDRFGQVRREVLFTADGYFYAGKTLDSLAPIAAVLRKLAGIEPRRRRTVRQAPRPI